MNQPDTVLWDPESADAAVACPVGPVVELVFSRWTTPILIALHFHDRQRFVELERRIDAVSPKVLTGCLRRLERDGLITRTYYPEVPPRAEYEITDLGRTLAPLFAHLTTWGSSHLAEVEKARQAYDGESGKP